MSLLIGAERHATHATHATLALLAPASVRPTRACHLQYAVPPIALPASQPGREFLITAFLSRILCVMQSNSLYVDALCFLSLATESVTGFASGGGT